MWLKRDALTHRLFCCDGWWGGQFLNKCPVNTGYESGSDSIWKENKHPLFTRVYFYMIRFSLKLIISASGAESVVMITSWQPSSLIVVYREYFAASQELCHSVHLHALNYPVSLSAVVWFFKQVIKNWIPLMDVKD